MTVELLESFYAGLRRQWTWLDLPVQLLSVFALEINTGSLPTSFYKAVGEAAMRTLTEGLYGWEVVDCVVTMTHGILHRDWANSTAADHRKLAPLTVMDALRRAGTEVQEPIQAFHFECPADTLGSFARVLPEFGEMTSEPLVKAPDQVGRVDVATVDNGLHRWNSAN